MKEESMGQIENINTEINIYVEAAKIKKMICLMEEQLFLYRMYTNRIDWSLFSEFEYTNRDTSESEYLEKFYIKNFKNGEKFLYPHGRHLPITVNPVKLLKDFEVDKNGSEELDIMYHTLYGDITIIYDLANGYDVRYNYYGHSDKKMTLCEVKHDLRICNKKNKVIYEFSIDFMRYHMKTMYPIDRSFIEEIIDFDEKSILKDDEEYRNAGMNQLKKKERDIIAKIQKLAEENEERFGETAESKMESHLSRKKPADYDKVLSLDYTNMNFDIKYYNDFKDTWIPKKILYNITDNLDEIVRIFNTK